MLRGSDIQVLDLTDPGHPVGRGTVPSQRPVDGLVALGRRAYIVRRDLPRSPTLEVLDATDMDHPAAVAFLDLDSPGSRRHLYLPRVTSP